MHDFELPALRIQPGVDFPHALVERVVDDGNPAHKVLGDGVADRRVLFRGLGHRRRRLCDVVRDLRRPHALVEEIRALRQQFFYALARGGGVVVGNRSSSGSCSSSC